MRITLKELKALGLEVEVTGGNPNQREPPGKPEERFVDRIMEYAGLRGWRRVHFRPAKTDKGWRTALQGDKGFPDVIALRGKRGVVIEAKAGKNKTSEDQDLWLEFFRAVGFEVYVMYPEQWDEVERILD